MGSAIESAARRVAARGPVSDPLITRRAFTGECSWWRMATAGRPPAQPRVVLLHEDNRPARDRRQAEGIYQVYRGAAGVPARPRFDPAPARQQCQDAGRGNAILPVKG